MDLKKLFFKFWRTESGLISIARDITVALIAVLIVLLILWSYTGQWLAAPMVAIESGSMEHPNPPFGRLGTIDAGDMVLVQKVYSKKDLAPHGGPYAGSEANNGWKSYGDFGDVIIYKPYGSDDRSQIIHRAMCWVEVSANGSNFTYAIEEYGIIEEKSITIPELGLENYYPKWNHSGYLTKGDNNMIIDQLSSNICSEPIKVGWITGKARSEIPWLGTINLFFEDLMTGRNTVSNVHDDSLICLGILIAILISVPIGLDLKEYIKDKKSKHD